jgi:hypothetical protein
MNEITKTKHTEKPAIKSTEKQVRLVVDGCAVKLSFAPRAEGERIEVIKKMILGGMARV